jgi:hypothetical protein
MLERLSLCHLHISQLFTGKAVSIPLDRSPLRKAPALPVNIKLGWKSLTVKSTLTWYSTVIASWCNKELVTLVLEVNTYKHNLQSLLDNETFC